MKKKLHHLYYSHTSFDVHSFSTTEVHSSLKKSLLVFLNIFNTVFDKNNERTNCYLHYRACNCTLSEEHGG